MNPEQPLEEAFRAAGRRMPVDTDGVRSALTRRIARRRRRQAILAVVSATVAVAVLAGGSVLVGGRHPADSGGSAHTALPSGHTSAPTRVVAPDPGTTFRTASTPTLGKQTKLAVLHSAPVVSPIAVAGPGPDWRHVDTRDNGRQVFVMWNPDGDMFRFRGIPDTVSSSSRASSSFSSSSAGAPPFSGLPDNRDRGYAVTASLSDIPWTDVEEVPVSRTSVALSYRGGPASLTTYTRGGETGEWLSWAIPDGRIAHAWLAGARDQQTMLDFADSIVVQPQQLPTNLQANLTIPGYTVERSTFGSFPQSLTQAFLTLCRPGAPPKENGDSADCLIIELNTTRHMGGVCGTSMESPVEVTAGGTQVFVCPKTQAATVSPSGQDWTTGHEISVFAPAGSTLSRQDLADLAVSVQVVL